VKITKAAFSELFGVHFESCSPRTNLETGQPFPALGYETSTRFRPFVLALLMAA
jgi:hypothetical protein